MQLSIILLVLVLAVVFKGVGRNSVLYPSPAISQDKFTILVLVIENKVTLVIAICVFFVWCSHEYLTLNKFVIEVVKKHIWRGLLAC